MHICTKSSVPSVAICEAPGSLNGFKIIHKNLTNPHYLMFQWEGSPEYTFGVKNIQKSEVRPLHKFEQDLHGFQWVRYLSWGTRCNQIPGCTTAVVCVVSVLSVDVRVCKISHSMLAAAANAVCRWPKSKFSRAQDFVYIPNTTQTVTVFCKYNLYFHEMINRPTLNKTCIVDTIMNTLKTWVALLYKPRIPI